MERGPNLGRPAGAGAQRDAVHIAVVPAVAAADLKPGQKVNLNADGHAVPLKWVYDDFVGVVDPYVAYDVAEGERFWLLLVPGTITSLRHEWTHPAFPLVSDKQASEAWLRAGCAELETSYEGMIEGLLDAKDPHVCFGDDNWRDFGGTALFWHHVEVVTGRKFDEPTRERTGFWCSC